MIYKEGEVRHGEVIEKLLKKEREENEEWFITKKGGKWKKKYEELCEKYEKLYEKVKDAEYMKEEINSSFYSKPLIRYIKVKMNKIQDEKVKVVVERDELKSKIREDVKWSKEKQEWGRERMSLKKGFDTVIEDVNFWKRKMQELLI